MRDMSITVSANDIKALAIRFPEAKNALESLAPEAFLPDLLEFVKGQAIQIGSGIGISIETREFGSYAKKGLYLPSTANIKGLYVRLRWEIIIDDQNTSVLIARIEGLD